MATSINIKKRLMRVLLTSSPVYKEIIKDVDDLVDWLNGEIRGLISEPEKWVLENMPELIQHQAAWRMGNLMGHHLSGYSSKLYYCDLFRNIPINLDTSLPVTVNWHVQIDEIGEGEDGKKDPRNKKIKKINQEILVRAAELVKLGNDLVKLEEDLDKFFETYGIREIKQVSPKIYQIYESDKKATDKDTD